MGDIRIELNNNTFTAGSQINGVIHLNLTNPIDQSELIVYIKGKAKTRIRTTGGEHSRTYHDSDEFFRQDLQLTSGTHSAGLKKYQFSFLLPNNLPPSLEYGSSCSIKYKVKAKIKKSKGFIYDSYIREEMYVRVISIMPSRPPPQPYQKTQSLQNYFCCPYCCCCESESGSVNIIAQLNQYVVLPGQKISGVVRIITQDLDTKLSHVKIQPQYKVHYKAKYHTRTLMHRIENEKLSLEDMQEGEERVFNFSYTIPTDVDLFNAESDLINCLMVLYVEVVNIGKARVTGKKEGLSCEFVVAGAIGQGPPAMGNNRGQGGFVPGQNGQPFNQQVNPYGNGGLGYPQGPGMNDGYAKIPQYNEMARF